MNIKKLTIAPVIRGARRIVIDSPTPERAQLLITEKLSTNYENSKPMKSKKLPKILHGFVNPETRVSQIIRNLI